MQGVAGRGSGHTCTVSSSPPTLVTSTDPGSLPTTARWDCGGLRSKRSLLSRVPGQRSAGNDRGQHLMAPGWLLTVRSLVRSLPVGWEPAGSREGHPPQGAQDAKGRILQ